MYKVLSEFADLQDGNHIYRVGDVYPREGYTPKDERVDELSTGKNLLHKPLIQKVEVETVPQKIEEAPEVEEQLPEETVDETVDETEAEEEQPKRKRGKKNTDD